MDVPAPPRDVERRENPNDEIRMTNQIRSPNDEKGLRFGFRHSGLIRISDFVIRH